MKRDTQAALRRRKRDALRDVEDISAGFLWPQQLALMFFC